jgi:hypothetical protein
MRKKTVKKFFNPWVKFAISKFGNY